MDQIDGVLELLDDMRAAGVGIGLALHAGSPVLVIDPPAARAALAERIVAHWAVLTWVAMGRYSGHAPARCSECGAITMLSIVNSSGTRRGAPSVGWPRCISTPRCKGRREIRPVDTEGVAKVARRSSRQRIS